MTVHKPHLTLYLQTERVTTATILPVKPSSATGSCCQGVPHLFSFHHGLDLQTRWFPCLSGSQDLSQKHSQSTEKRIQEKEIYNPLADSFILKSLMASPGTGQFQVQVSPEGV